MCFALTLLVMCGWDLFQRTLAELPAAAAGTSYAQQNVHGEDLQPREARLPQQEEAQTWLAENDDVIMALQKWGGRGSDDIGAAVLREE